MTDVVSLTLNPIFSRILNIKKTELVNDKTYFTVEVDGSERTLHFDNVCTHWLREFFNLLEYIAKERDKRKVNIYNNTESNTIFLKSDQLVIFFGLAESVVAQIIYYFVINELSNSDENHNLEFLCYHLLFHDTDYSGAVEEHAKDANVAALQTKYNELLYAQRIKYLKRIVTEDFNAFYVATFFDFYISFWSEFEACINGICRGFENEIQQISNESHFKAMNKFFKNVYKNNMNHDKIIDLLEQNRDLYFKKFPKFISFNEKRDYLFKVIGKDNYSRDQKQDRKILDFCAALRNTLHNNGLNINKDKEVFIGGKNFKLKEMEIMFYQDFADMCIIAKEIFDIYLAIYDGLCAVQNKSE